MATSSAEVLLSLVRRGPLQDHAQSRLVVEEHKSSATRAMLMTLFARSFIAQTAEGEAALPAMPPRASRSRARVCSPAAQLRSIYAARDRICRWPSCHAQVKPLAP